MAAPCDALKMSSPSPIAIAVDGVSKYYHMYDRPSDRLKHAIVPKMERLVGRAPSQYGRDFWALRDVSFDVARGETVGIIGRNGSGKSTLLQIICGTLAPSAGSVQVNGRVAALLELGSGFNPEFSGRENVYLNASVLGLSKDEIDRRFDTIAAFAGIGDFIEQPVKTYSSGMFVRLAFAVSVSIDPDVLVIDEALSVGDLAFQQRCLHRLAELRESGTTILLVTHDIMLTRNYCSRVVYLDGGQVRATGDPETVGEQYLKDVFAAQQAVAGGEALDWKTGAGRLRFGTERGAVTGCTLVGSRHQGPVFDSGEAATVTVAARVAADVKTPELVAQIRDVRGYVLYGLATTIDALEVERGGEEVRLTARMDIDLTLGPGEYSLVIGLNDRPGESLVTVLDKVVPALTFTIAPVPGNRAHGPVDLRARWRPHGS